MITISDLENTHLLNMKISKGTELIRAHQKAHSLVENLQSENCTVSKGVATELMRLQREFAHIVTIDEHIIALSLCETDAQGVDMVYLIIDKVPDAQGRYEVVSASDESKAMLQVI